MPMPTYISSASLAWNLSLVTIGFCSFRTDEPRGADIYLSTRFWYPPIAYLDYCRSSHNWFPLAHRLRCLSPAVRNSWKMREIKHLHTYLCTRAGLKLYFHHHQQQQHHHHYRHRHRRKEKWISKTWRTQSQTLLYVILILGNIA